MHRLFRSSRPGKSEYASLVLFLVAWLATISLIATPRDVPFRAVIPISPILPD